MSVVAPAVAFAVVPAVALLAKAGAEQQVAGAVVVVAAVEVVVDRLGTAVVAAATWARHLPGLAHQRAANSAAPQDL